MTTSLQDRKYAYLSIIGMLIIAGVACDLSNLVGATVTELEPSGNAGIAGRIWHDSCANPPRGTSAPDVFPPGCVLDPVSGELIANSLLDADERGIENIELHLGRGVCPGEPIATSRSAPDGMFLFAGLAADTYCVKIDPGDPNNHDLLLPGRWTYPAIPDSQAPMEVTVALAEGEVRADIYFAWDYALEPVYQAPAVQTPTQDLTPSATPTPTETPAPTGTPQATGSPAPSPTPTFSSGDPRANLGDPTWDDDLQNDGDWFLYSDDHVSFEMQDGQMNLTAYNPDFYSGWSLGWRKDSNMFIEATMRVQTCSGRDTIGLVFRAPDVSSGYLYGVSCDGRYSLRLWDGEEMTRIQEWTSHSALRTGSDQTQRIAVLTNGNLIRLYANGEFLKELVDATYNGEGLFGVFISAADTANFQAVMSEYLYWNSP